MGNTLRKTFGNMCGAEASKDLSSEDHLKPVAKPKKNKKEKKKKKTGDINNLTAQSIPEDDGISPLPVRQTEISKENELKDQGAKSNAININHVEVNEKSDSRNSETIAVSLKSHSEKTDSPKTYIIQTIPETSTFESQNLNQSVTVMTKSVTMATDPDHLKEVLIEDEEHNMLEYGKYCFIDPTTGDIQVLRTRSRSLNSLVSFTALSQLSRSPSHSSSRSNLSRFGSFEFVTGGEVIIAEKNQAAFTSR